jgi:hypothetical protein
MKEIKKMIILNADDFRRGIDGQDMFYDLIVEPLELPPETESVTIWVSACEVD